jgi:hypothetical protein
MKSEKWAGSLWDRPERVVSGKEKVTWEGVVALGGGRENFLSMEGRGGSAGGQPRGGG